MKIQQKKIRVGILGATGMVGQRFISLLSHHPWFSVTCVAASRASKGKTYEEAVHGRWHLPANIPKDVQHLRVYDVATDKKHIASEVDLVFSALNMEKEHIQEIEIAYAAHDVVVVSNNSAHRWTPDIPMIIPEVNPHHTDIIPQQKKQRKWNKGCIVVKPNCSIQSYVSILHALSRFQPTDVHVVSLQAVSGAGKTLRTWEEMQDNLIPWISGEEEKSENEPLKIWGHIRKGKIVSHTRPHISATCIRVPVSDGHMAHVSVSFKQDPQKEDLIHDIQTYAPSISLPSSPTPCITYFSESDRPQTKKDRMIGNGMGISMGRLHRGGKYHWSFVCLSHNTIRGAAGGAILTAELLKAQKYI